MGFIPRVPKKAQKEYKLLAESLLVQKRA